MLSGSSVFAHSPDKISDVPCPSPVNVNASDKGGTVKGVPCAWPKL